VKPGGHAALGGVAAGFADYFNVDPSLLRSE
jgi:phage shock protein PspC (stress-responsive transcriptional regulator)